MYFVYLLQILRIPSKEKGVLVLGKYCFLDFFGK